MGRFANAVPEDENERARLAIIWMAGLLEGEGSFLKPIPSDPRRPIIACRMTDPDVVGRVAMAFGTAVQANSKGRHKLSLLRLSEGGELSN